MKLKQLMFTLDRVACLTSKYADKPYHPCHETAKNYVMLALKRIQQDVGYKEIDYFTMFGLPWLLTNIHK